MGQFVDLAGQRFWRLVVKESAGRDKQGKIRWLYLCDCGTEGIALASDLRRGYTKSCGCLRRETAANNGGRLRVIVKHGHSRRGTTSSTYMSWRAMNQRCLDPNAERFPKYGALGVTVCDRWLGEDGFQNFLADLGDRPEGTTLGRFGDVGNYEPSNVKWMTPPEQGAEQRKKNALKKAA